MIGFKGRAVAAMAMATDLDLARRLQAVDDQIDELTREIEGLPRHVEQIESRLAAHRQELAAKRAELADNAKQQRLLDGQIGDFRRKIDRLQDQMTGAKTNAQFHAFQHEIQYCRDEIDKREESILDKMELADALGERVERAESDLGVESAKVASDVRDAESRIESDKRARETRVSARSALVDQITPTTVRTYERIRRTRGKAVAGVTDETCGSCHVRLRPKFLQDLRLLEDGVLTCESCGLIVFLADDDVVPAEDVLGEMTAGSHLP